MALGEDDFIKIQDWIRANPHYIFDSANQAHFIDDVERYNLDCDPESIINYGDLFLFDAVIRELWICQYTKKKRKLDGRVIPGRPVYRLSRNTMKDFDEIFHGSVLLPKNYE